MAARVLALLMRSRKTMVQEKNRPRILLVEDEHVIRDLICFHLNLAEYESTAVADGRDALQLATTRPFDLVILDLVLPGVDGITLCQAIRREGPNREVPILMLTARCEESDKVVGLESGADDYLTKPFGIRELLARLKALLRRPRSTWRSASHQRSAISQLGITIDPTRRRVHCDGAIIALSPQEFDLLYVLMSNPGIVFERSELLARVWEDDVFVTARGVDTLVKRLRRKIEPDPAAPTRVITVWGSGYKFGEL